MDMLTWDNMDDFDDNILLGNFALEIPSMDELMDIPTSLNAAINKTRT